MTIDEAIERYKNNAEYERTHGNLQGCLDFRQLAEWLKDYKRLKEQEPCEDAIDRAEAMTEIMMFAGNVKSDEEDIYIKVSDAVQLLRELPSVNPQEPKTGHWIEGRSDNPNIHNILCSRCFEGYPSKGHANSQHTKEKFKWCPKCGAKMIEPQESEDKE